MLRPSTPTADTIIAIIGDQSSARLLRLGHNDEEFLKIGPFRTRFLRCCESPQELLRHGCRLAIPHPGVTRFTDRGVAISYSGSRVPRSEGETRHDRDLGLDPDLLHSVPGWRTARTRRKQVRRASPGSDASSAMTAAATLSGRPRCRDSFAQAKPGYCLGMPARSITPAHLLMSPASRAFNSSGVLALASIPRSA